MGIALNDEAVKEIKMQWERLWQERIDDKVKAEGIANMDYSLLFVERGTVVFATRNFKQLDFRDILEQHRVIDVDRIVPPDPSIGGWGKFIRTAIVGQRVPRRIKRAQQYAAPEKRKQQLKKGGRGWLHV